MRFKNYIMCGFFAEELCTLVITEAFPEDSGLFKCVAHNPFGSVSCSATLEVYSGEMSKDVNLLCFI